MRYLEKKIAATKSTEPQRYGVARDGYTLRSGAPTQWLIKLEGERIWRRLMFWCFSNSGTYFVRIKGKCLIVSEYAAHDLESLRVAP